MAREMNQNNEFLNTSDRGIQLAISRSMSAMGLGPYSHTLAQNDSNVFSTPVLDKNEPKPNHDAMTDLNRQELDAKLSQNKAEVDVRLANFDASVKTGFADLRAEFAEMRAEMAKQTGEMRAEMANVRADSHKSTTEVTRWVVGFGIAILGAIFAFNRSSDKPAAPPAQAIAPASPVILAVPAGSAVLSTPQALPAPAVSPTK